MRHEARIMIYFILFFSETCVDIVTVPPIVCAPSSDT